VVLIKPLGEGFYTRKDSRNGQTSSSLTGRTGSLPISVRLADQRAADGASLYRSRSGAFLPMSPGPGRQSERTYRSTQSYEPYSMSSRVGSMGRSRFEQSAMAHPDTSLRAGGACRMARRTHSATETAATLASRFTRASSSLSRLICVRIVWGLVSRSPNRRRARAGCRTRGRLPRGSRRTPAGRGPVARRWGSRIRVRAWRM
jgi:hypothetical protein